MRYYPVFLDIKGKSCVVIGAGAVAARKTEGLVKAGAIVTVIGTVVAPALKALSNKGGGNPVRLVRRSYRKGDLEGAHLVVSATDSAVVNKAVHEEATSLGIPVNCVDAPEYCSFIVPAVVDRESLVIAVSTSGECPALAARLRKEIESEYGPEYAAFLEILGAVRRKLLKSRARRDKKERVIRQLAASEIPALIRAQERCKIDAVLKSVCGAGYTLATLGIRLKAVK